MIEIKPMKNLVLSISVLSLLLVAPLAAQKEEPQHKLVQFQMAVLKKGPKWATISAEDRGRIRQQHLDNVLAMLDAGKMIIAGPFGDDGELRGIFVFRVSSLKEAQDLCATDPMVKVNRLAVELHPWRVPEGVLP